MLKSLRALVIGATYFLGNIPSSLPAEDSKSYIVPEETFSKEEINNIRKNYDNEVAKKASSPHYIGDRKDTLDDINLAWRYPNSVFAEALFLNPNLVISKTTFDTMMGKSFQNTKALNSLLQNPNTPITKSLVENALANPNSSLAKILSSRENFPITSSVLKTIEKHPSSELALNLKGTEAYTRAVERNNLPKQKHIFDIVGHMKIENKIKETKGLTVVKTWAEWCGPCKAYGPNLDSASDNFNGDVSIIKVDFDKDENKEFIERHQISSLPTTLVFKGGELVDFFTGAEDEFTLTSRFQKLLKE